MSCFKRKSPIWGWVSVSDGYRPPLFISRVALIITSFGKTIFTALSTRRYFLNLHLSKIIHPCQSLSLIINCWYILCRFNWKGQTPPPSTAKVSYIKTKIIHSFKDSYCFVMEYLEGGDLQTFIREQKQKKLTEKLSRKFFTQLTTAVQYLHNNGTRIFFSYSRLT